MSELSTKRRWKFSLRSLFVLVTLCCVWLAWMVHTTKVRRDFLRETPHMQNGKHSQKLSAMVIGKTIVRVTDGPQANKPISVVRRWFGDAAVETICAQNETQEQQALAYFPEARVMLLREPDADEMLPPILPPTLSPNVATPDL